MSSTYIVLAIESDDQRVVGFANAISDGFFSAFIPMVEVLPEYQGQGIGRQLVTRLLDKLNGFYSIDVACDEEIQPFYESLVLKRGRGILMRNYRVTFGDDESIP